jgi:hypothetical protein
MTGQPDSVDDPAAPHAAPSAGDVCAFGTPGQAHLDGTGCPACAAETAQFLQQYADSVAAGDLYRSGHTPAEWAASTPLLPFDPDVIQWDNGEDADEDD